MLGPLLDDLLRLYFQNIHAYYPVIDEFDFEQSFSGFSDDGNLRQSRALVLTSMLLCASMYLNTNKSYGYGQWTQKKLQIAVFAATKDLYNAASETGNQTALTQACMLLSYWSPCYQEQAHINSAWLARAFVHAEAAGLREMTSETLTDRSRLIWCCCLVRDRIISYSSRRALNPMSSCTNGVRVSREDFGLEICMPRYSDPDSRNGLVDAFLLLCRLSEILADINEFEQKQRDGERKVGRKEVLRVSQFDIRLREWKRGFQIWKAGPKNSTIQDSRGSYYLRCVVSE
ncbi:hypothetical protein EJ06DRAFT_203981 [Trichodelitschia bisporula]|uniref:Xylanolytic transcriptional activator regulatory domain-containing protein n=1 Tax=Trichodelitschia bisporula TaxID=703511 RepID=A0A6G1I891_9PEZI|nr:hypothetical protein EJ06DRAFT_203981 [Trichodelitschia bisporula]